VSSNRITEEQRKSQKAKEDLPAWLSMVRSQVASLKFGTVQITVHDSRVIQIERLEKLRLDHQQTGNFNLSGSATQ